MPPSRKSTKTEHKWTCGGMRGISHVELIAYGGFGEVHKMLDERTGEVFARKIIRPLGDKVTREDIENEAKAVSNLCSGGRSKYVVVVLKQDWLPRQPGSYYIDMEYCEESLDDRIKSSIDTNWAAVLTLTDLYPDLRATPGDDLEVDQETRLSQVNELSESLALGIDFDWESVIDIIDDIVSGLIYLHDQGTAHRDLKPKNVLFSNKENCWKLADFGSTAEATSKRLNTTRFSRGTSGYRAPETLDLINPRFNQKSDLFALGCIIYELVTGEKLFSEDFVVFSYSTSGKLPKSVWWPASPASEPDRLQALEVSAAKMLEIAPSQRCNARQAQDSLKFIRIGDNIPRFNTGTGLPVQRFLQNSTLTVGMEQGTAEVYGSLMHLPFSRFTPDISAATRPLSVTEGADQQVPQVESGLERPTTIRQDSPYQGQHVTGDTRRPTEFKLETARRLLRRRLRRQLSITTKEDEDTMTIEELTPKKY